MKNLKSLVSASSAPLSGLSHPRLESLVAACTHWGGVPGALGAWPELALLFESNLSTHEGNEVQCNLNK